ncbi:MAG: hypothetical protein JNN33_07785 [Rhodospirillaceae bacterium]|jgi:hypothetical protein|nr:hypothetical protein [Rhodospirillaceae bacterium]
MAMRLGSLVLSLALTICAATAAEACGWRLKEGRAPAKGGGILCNPGQTEYQIATLACEHTPLQLDLEGHCGADRTQCHVRLTIDGEIFTLTGANHPAGQIWDGFVSVPLAWRADVVDALTAAEQVDVSVEDRSGWRLPTEGLAETLGALAVSCRARTS